MQRIEKRGRTEEDGITQELMKNIERAHARMQKTLATPSAMGFCVDEVHHIHVDANKPPDEVAADIAQVVRGALARVSLDEDKKNVEVGDLVLTP